MAGAWASNRSVSFVAARIVGVSRSSASSPEGEELHLDGEVLKLNESDLVKVCGERRRGDRRRDGGQVRPLPPRPAAGVPNGGRSRRGHRDVPRAGNRAVYLNLLNPSWMIFGEGFRKDVLRQFSVRVFDIVPAVLLLAISLAGHAPDSGRDLGGRRAASQDLLPATARWPGRSGLRALCSAACAWMRRSRARRSKWSSVTRGSRASVRCFGAAESTNSPQLVNVLRGEMSVRRPRPERP